MDSREGPGYKRVMCDVLVTSRPPLYLQIHQGFHFLPNSLIAVRITGFSVRVDDTFVEDETILFDAWNHFDTFLFQISLEIIRRHYIGGTAMIQWVLQFSQNIVFHGLKIQDSCPAIIQGESSDLTHHFTLPCRVPIVLGAPRNELCNDIPIQFICARARRGETNQQGEECPPWRYQNTTPGTDRRAE